jgi:hypothetical protein
MVRSVWRIAVVSMVAAVCAVRVGADPPGTGGAPNWIPDVSFSYVDPATGERVECGESCRRFTVPDGVELEVRVRVRDGSGGPAVDDPVSWDLWLNQPLHPFPGLDLGDCVDGDTGRVDKACWQALSQRVDWQAWNALSADVTCVPYESGGCRDETIRLAVNPAFEGARRRGVYHVAVWVDRFQSAVESDEFDNYAGPVRITVEQGRNAAGPQREPEIVVPNGGSLVADPSLPQPYGMVVIPAAKETSISLSSHRARGTLEFSPGCVGKALVEVTQTGSYETMVVRIEKTSTGEVLAEGVGKGRMRLEGGVDAFLLRDDRRFRVVVTPGQGSRGVRATVKVSYPDRLRFVSN